MNLSEVLRKLSNNSNSKPRIALFIPSLSGGGAERVMLTLASTLADQGYSVDLVLVKAQGKLLASAPGNVNIVDLGARRVITSLPSLAGYLRRVKPDAMVSALNHANCVAVWARWFSRQKTRLVLTEHSHLSTATTNSRTLRGRLMPVFMRNAYAKADAVVAVSSGVADDLAEVVGIARDTIEVIYNPVVTPGMLALSRETVADPWFEQDQPPVILSVGRLTAPKDYPTLLKAFAQLRKQRAARLVILGEGEERESLEQLANELGIQDDVALPGFIDNPYAYMRAAALFVLSSRWEGLPTVLIEALACGTPVISTNCRSGPAEILDGGTWGTLVPVGDVDVLAQAMQTQLNGQTSMAEGYETHAEKFSDTEAAKAYLQLMGIAKTPEKHTDNNMEPEHT